ncbi:MAG: ATP-binding protein, partial [Okeania sp. SIO1H6]|nr:ATP-binding protein [Okeania sp. SIO1H6]
MPTGGAYGKLGDRYEGFWMVFCMLDVMTEKAEYIRLEKPGEDAFEFFVRQGNRTKCYQVKRQITSRGHWPLSVLEDNKNHVLSDFWKALKDPNIDCVFTSTEAAGELKTLAYLAESSISFEEFQKKCLNKTEKYLNKTWSKNFQILCEKSKCSEKEAYEGLKRVDVETVAENFLVDTIKYRIAPLVEGDPQSIRCELAELALEKIHQELTAYDIWNYLTVERKYQRREWHKDPHVLVAVEKINDTYLYRFEHENIAGEIITRDEVSIVVDKLTSQDSKNRGVLLTGEAGVGKSGVIGQVLKELKNRPLPILAFRIDSCLQPTQSPDDLGEQLRLPSSPSIVLAGVAQKRDCVLIIDQVDAVSQASGRNPDFFECIRRIIKQAETFPNIRLLVACRKFDVDNDSRIRDLTGEKGIVETVSINKLAHTTVKEICSKLGLDAPRLSQKQLDLLSIPLHLSLLAETIEDKTIDILSFKTAKDLFDLFCQRKRDKLRERLGYSIQKEWKQVIDALSEYMSEQQTLSAPKTTVRGFEDTVNFMVSEHILTIDNKRISFFHESFFDYAFADNFSASGTNLLSFLTSDEQHLFRRAQVRQILLHERDNDFELYLDYLKELLTSSDIRFHIKELALALLIKLENPRQEEWEIIAPLVDDSYPLKNKVWQIFYSVSWFKLLDSLNIIHDWLNSGDEELIDRLNNLLSIIQRQLPDRVAKIVEPYIGVSDAWQKRLIILVHRADISAGRGFFELFLRLIDEGILDEVKDPITLKSDFWNLIYSLPKKHPDWSCETISHYLNRRLIISLANNQLNPFDSRNGTIPNSQFAKRIFMDSAKNSPEAFVENVLPFMIQVMELTADKENDVPWKDAVWQHRIYGSSSTDTDAILEAMETALSNLAAEQPEIFA